LLWNCWGAAAEARLSRYHFLRIFCQLAGLTPHQYIVRARLRRAALELITEPGQVLNIALASGFGDVSNFNHAFRAEFGVSPSLYRKIECAGAPRR
jgi:AraC-like DNA-binding protein